MKAYFVETTDKNLYNACPWGFIYITIDANKGV